MTVLRVGRSPVRLRPRRHLQLVPPPVAAPSADHCPGVTLEVPCDFRLRLVEYDDGVEVRRFECDACGRVSFR